MDDILKCIPIAYSDALHYRRDELVGGITFISRRHPELRELGMNKVGKYIFEHADGSNTILDIVNNIISEYSECKKNQVISDVINILVNFWALGVIKWKEKTPYDYTYNKIDGNKRFKLLSEDEVIDYEDNIIGNYYTNPLYNKKLVYSKIFLKQKICLQHEVFFVLKISNIDKIRISLMYDVGTAILSIGSLYKGEIEDNIVIQEFLNWCVDTFVKCKAYNINKILKIRFYADNNTEHVLIELLKNTGFKCTGILKDELRDSLSDLRLFDFNVESA